MLHLICPLLGPELACSFFPGAKGRSRSNDRRANSRSKMTRSNGWRFAALLVVMPLFVLALSGCSGGMISGASSGSLQISPGNLSFGSVVVGNTATSNVSLVNLSASPVTISSFNITGKSFALNSQASLPITLAAAGGSYTLSVKFNPAAAGALAGQLTVNNNSAAEGAAVVGLSGTGVDSVRSAPQISSISCSYAVAGPGTDACAVTLNAAAPDGGATVNLSSSNAAVSVPASVTVAAGATSASFTSSISAVSGSQAVVLTASSGGAMASFDLQVEIATPALSVSTLSVAFGNEAVNTPVSQTLTLTSTGAATVTISAASLTGTGFSLPGASFPIALTPGQSTTLTVGFDPTTAGASTGQLNLTSDAAGGTSTAIALSGAGMPTLTAFSCTTSSYTGAGTDTCTVAMSAPAASGGYAINLSSNSSAVTVPSTVTVAAGASSASFSATVSSVTSTQTATLSANTGGTPLTFGLQLKATVPTLSVGSSSLNFGSVSVGTATSQLVTLSSTGSGSVTISSATVSGLGFSISGATFPLTLSSTQSVTLTVQFDPSIAGALSGQITLTSNSTSGSTTTISLSGTGVPVLTALSCANSSMTGSGTDTCTVTLNAAAASGGVAVGLSSNNAAVSVPSTITIPAGSASATFAATVSSVSTAQNVTLSASAGTVSKTFALQLTASVSGISITSTSIAFGDVTLNTPATQTITLTSTGALPLIVTSVTISGTGFSVLGATLPVTLSTNQTVTLSVVFDPTTTGAATGQLLIVSDSLANPTETVNLSGTGQTASASYEVNLTWDAPSSSTDPVAGYNVYRSPSGSSSYQLLGTVSSSQLKYTDTDSITDGQTYDYIVESVDASGNESVPSNMAAVTIPNS
jgi:hypothetical protein